MYAYFLDMLIVAQWCQYQPSNTGHHAAATMTARSCPAAARLEESSLWCIKVSSWISGCLNTVAHDFPMPLLQPYSFNDLTLI
jgi:hypothetical protein